MNYFFSNPLNKLSKSFILLAYAFITVVTPRFYAADSGGTKFLALALLNFVVSFYFIFRKKELPPTCFRDFFTKTVGFIYTLLLLVSFLSCFKAVNMAESLVSLAKVFTVFNSVLFIAILLKNDLKQFTIMAIAMTVLLLFDSLVIFYQFWSFTDKYADFTDMYKNFSAQVTSIYSNKNILASALFIKLPFALWLWTFRKGFLQVLGLLSTFTGVVAILPLNARAFYIGLLILVFAYVLFLFFRILTGRKHGKTTLISLSILVLFPVFMFSGWLLLGKFFPGIKRFNIQDQVVARLATISADRSAGSRIVSWQRSENLIKSEPVLGTGLGNWKVRILKYENQTTPYFRYYFYNHNDFIQTTAETGILGGLLFLSIFILVGWYFLKVLFKKSQQTVAYLFLPAFGMLCYSVDAFFNFPHDRPEIQSLWILFMGSAIAFTPAGKWSQRLTSLFHRFPGNTLLHKKVTVPLPLPARFRKRAVAISPKQGFVLLYFLLILASLWILYQNMKSLQLQSLYFFEVSNRELKTPATVFLEGFPAIPTISIEGEPIAAIKARYLISENDYAGAIGILQPDRSSPWDTRREFLLSQAYQLKKNDDEAIRYAKVVFAIKPFFKDNLNNLLNLLETREQYEEAIVLIDQYCAAFDSLSPGLENYLKMYGDDRPNYPQKQKELKRKAALKRADPEYTLAGYYLKQGDSRKYAFYHDRAIKKVPELAE